MSNASTGSGHEPHTAGNSRPLLAVETLVSGYGKKQVLHGIDLKVGLGEIVSVIGHNGAGKSTLLKAIFGMIPVWQGRLSAYLRSLQSANGRDRRAEADSQPENKPAEVFFLKSGTTADTTCTRVFEDLKAVVDYVATIPEVQSNRIYIIGISLSVYLAAKLAATDDRVQAVILVGPPFDIVEMLDNFRRHYQAEARVPTFEGFLKAKPNYLIANWHNNPQRCNYFNHVATAYHLIDIACRGADAHSRRTFLDSLGSITRSGRKVAILYTADDPIVDAARNIPYLEQAMEAGHISKENLSLYRLPVGGHYYPELGNGYTGRPP